MSISSIFICFISMRLNRVQDVPVSNTDWYKSHLMEKFVSMHPSLPNDNIQIIETAEDQNTEKNKVQRSQSNLESIFSEIEILGNNSTELAQDSVENPTFTNQKTKGTNANSGKDEISTIDNSYEILNTEEILDNLETEHKKSKDNITALEKKDKYQTDKSNNQSGSSIKNSLNSYNSTVVNIDVDSDFDDEWWEINADDSDINDSSYSLVSDAETGSHPSVNSSLNKSSKNTYSDDFDESKKRLLAERSQFLEKNLSLFGNMWILIDKLCTEKTKEFFEMVKSLKSSNLDDLSLQSLTLEESKTLEKVESNSPTKVQQQEIFRNNISQV
ncbi:hypothetical protein BB560_000033 [Smittium megazygosporum]|uniref:Uncharacterized protein n=1 Tax=Smittium megazygosporum TaxID=133381 RepID=A0A2T9ZLK0_9FUNG|nr:hypothetical protein BB560_000033 [Smittium megazygosporum]